MVKGPGNLVMVPKTEGTVYFLPHHQDAKKVLLIRNDEKVPMMVSSRSAATSAEALAQVRINDPTESPFHR